MEYTDVVAVRVGNDLSNYEEALIIYNLLEDIAIGQIYYCEVSGALHFNFRIHNNFGYLDCKVTPYMDKYNIKVDTAINIATTLMLYEIDNVDGSELHNTMIEVIKYLDREWTEWTKDKEYKGWREYPKAKVIKYDDHGRRTSVS